MATGLRAARQRHAHAKLYAHDAGLAVAEHGAMLSGWIAVEPVLRDRLGRATAIPIRLDDVQVRAMGTTVVVVATVRRERS